MPNVMDQLGGWRGYLHAAAEVAGHLGASRHGVLFRMLVAKALYGLSAGEYGMFGLHRTPFRRLRNYRTKKQTTASIARINPAHCRPLVEDKLVFHRECQAAGLPTPALLAILSSRAPRDIGALALLADFDALMAHFRADPEIRLVLKPRNDALGTGVRFVALRGGQPFDIDDRALDVPAFAAALAFDMRRDDYLVQAFVPPHPQVARLGSGRALGTLRIVSLLHGGQCRLPYALLRIPAAGNVYDNFAGGSNGNLIATVDVSSGRIGPAWGRRDPGLHTVLQRFEHNPDTGLPICGETVPDWEEIRALVRRAAEVFGPLPLLGWDIAPSANGLVIIEANSNPDIIGAQVCCGQGARALLRPLWRA
jgi:hypothetical protein